MQKYLYLLIDILSFLPPFALSFDKKVFFFRKWKYLFPSMIIVAIPYLVWDEFFTQSGIWGFNPTYLSGIYLFSLPIEEVLFFFAIPYACVFTYEVLKVYIQKEIFSNKISKIISAVLVLLLFTGFLIYIRNLYTSITFIFLLLFILLFQFILKFKELRKFYFSYLIILFPFLLVNGILTGSFLEDPIVWYNNNENMALRLFTIPLEDIFYGMLLILLNVFLFEKFQKIKLSVVKYFV